MEQKRFSIKERGNSFKFAFRGLRILIKEEHNFRIHLFAAVGVIIAGFAFHINAFEWMAIVLAMGLVFVLEIINSSIENMADFISSEKDERIKKLKDLSAAAVLVAAITAVLIGLIVFVPKIMRWF